MSTLSWDTRNLRIVSVSARDVLDFFVVGISAELPSAIRVPDLSSSLPEGTELLKVQANWYDNTIEFLIANPSFSEVDYGERVPHWPEGRAGVFRLVKPVMRRVEVEVEVECEPAIVVEVK